MSFSFLFVIPAEPVPMKADSRNPELRKILIQISLDSRFHGNDEGDSPGFLLPAEACACKSRCRDDDGMGLDSYYLFSQVQAPKE